MITVTGFRKAQTKAQQSATNNYQFKDGTLRF